MSWDLLNLRQREFNSARNTGMMNEDVITNVTHRSGFVIKSLININIGVRTEKNPHNYEN